MSLFSHLRGIYQLGYVTADLAAAVEVLRAEMGAETFDIREQDLQVTIGDTQQPLKMRVAVANTGERQVEVIQPLSGATAIYADGINPGRPLSLHHIGIVIPGPVSNWLTMDADVHKAGQSFALSFAADHGPDPLVRFAYVDTRATLGHYTEYLWWSASLAGTSPALPRLAA